MILVTGATGFIGRHVVAALAARGDAVRALARPSTDVRDAAGLREVCRGVTAAIHLAGTYRGSPAELRATHVQGTANLLRALPDGVRLVYVSSTSVYGWDRPWPADVTTPPDPRTVYGAVKLNAERQVAAWERGEAVIVRPTIVYGPGDIHGMIPRALRMLRVAADRGFRLPLPGNGSNRVHLTHIDDLVAALLLALDDGKGTYLVAGPQPTPIREVLGVIADAAGIPPPRWGVPAFAARLGAAVIEETWRLLPYAFSPRRRAGEPPLSTHSIDVLTKDRAYDPIRAEEDLGWKPQVALDDGLPRTVDHLPVLGEREQPSPSIGGTRVIEPALEPGPPWRAYFDDPDEGLGTVYERFGLAQLIDEAMALTGSKSVLHAPMFGMTGIPGLDCVFQLRRGVRVGLADVLPERLEAVTQLHRDLGLPVPPTWTLSWPDTSRWPEELPSDFDLVASFAALWWCADPWEALAAQAAVATRGIFLSIPNRTVFMAVRERLWHRDMFTHLHEETLEPGAVEAHAEQLGLEIVAAGHFDLPPFPDTAFPLRQALVAAGRPRNGDASSDGGVWRWSIVPYLRGEQPDLEARMQRLGVLERAASPAVKAKLAHHRWWVLRSTANSSRTSPAAV